MKPWHKTLLFIIIVALELAFIVWTRWSYSHNFLDTLK